MKKLTAGIFATILGLTTVNAFAATAGTKVASTNYVDGAVAAANAYTDTKVGDIKIPSLEGYAKETWVEGKGYAVATKVAEDIAAATENMATTGDVATAKQEAISEAATAAAGLYETKESAKAYAKTADLAAVATSGNYADLTNVPTDLVTDADIANMATKTDIADMATKTDIAGMATQTWVEGKGYATTKAVDDLHQAQAQVIGVNTVDIKNLKDADTAFAQEQAAQDAEIEKKANSADVYTKTVADTTFVKVADIVDTYPATQAAQQ